MINLFKKIKELVAPQATAQMVADEAELTREVYSAHDELIFQMGKELAESAPISGSSAETLGKLSGLGFHSAEPVIQVKERKEKERYNNLLLRYKQVYPFHKFISRSIAIKVAEKYGLFISETHRYIAEIPEKNQREIVDFKIKRQDNLFYYYYNYTGYPKDYRDYNNYLIRSSSMAFALTSKAPHKKEGSAFDSQSTYEAWLDEWLPAQHLMIMAPANKLNLEKSEIKNRVIVDLNDPIVLHPVNGDGFLIVSSWGLEAADPEIVNHVNN